MPKGKKRRALHEELEKIDKNRREGRVRQHYQRIGKLRKRYQARPTMIRDDQGNMITEEEKIMNEWKNYFEELLNRPEPNDPFPDTILYGPEIKIEEPTIGEVKTAIKTLKNSKSPGKDNIPSEIWKFGGEALENRLYKLIGMIWREEKTPDDWEEGIIVPLHKKGDRLTCKNYLGISLWSTVYKIFTIILCNRMIVYSEAVVGEYQAGF